MDGKKAVEYKLLDVNDAEQTAECLSLIFTSQEPMTTSLGLSDQLFRSLATKYCRLAAEDGLSFIALEQKTGQVVGFIICVDLQSDPRLGEVDPEIIKAAAPSAALLSELENSFIKKMDFKLGDCLHMFYAGVDANLKGMGVATQLTEKALANAVSKGYKYALADCTSLKSQKVLTRLDFQEENRVVYANLQYDGPNPFANLEGYCALMVKELKS